jgi:thioredoxin-related protein
VIKAHAMLVLCALIGALLAATALTAVAAPPVPLASDLRRDSIEAARSATPLVLFFTLPNCTYCHTVRQNYLAPLVRGQAGQRYVVREIIIDSARSAAGLDGKPSTHRELAQRFEAQFAPAVLFIDGSGKALAAPLIGGDTAGMYGVYLETSLAGARAQLAKAVN